MIIFVCPHRNCKNRLEYGFDENHWYCMLHGWVDRDVMDTALVAYFNNHLTIGDLKFLNEECNIVHEPTTTP